MKFRILLLHTLTIVFLYPILAHELMYELGVFVEKLPHNQYWLYVQIFLSAPGLITIGLIFIFGVNHKSFYQYWGILLTCVGVWWLVEIILTVMREAA